MIVFRIVLVSIIILTGNQFVDVGHRVEVQFYGKPRQLVVRAVTGSYNSAKNPISSTQLKDKLACCDSATTNLSKKLKALNIDDDTPKDTKEAPPCDNDDNRSSHKNMTSSSSQPNGCASCEKDLEENESTRQITEIKRQTYPSEATSNMEHQSRLVHQSDSEPNQCGRQSVFYYISPEETHLTIHAHGTHQNKTSEPSRNVTFESIGGLQKQIALVREMIELPLKHPEMFTDYGKKLADYGKKGNMSKK